jgi:hypothetical protein
MGNKIPQGWIREEAKCVGLGDKLGGLPLKGIIIYYYFLKAKVDILSVVLSSCKGNVC